MNILKKPAQAFCLLCATSTGFSADAAVIDVTIRGSDAIWLAGRIDLDIPPANAAWPDGLIRHDDPTPEEILETMPPGFSVQPGDVIKVLDPADGGIDFFNGFGTSGSFFGPQGNGDPDSSNLTAFGGISGYRGTQGALVGVFLNDDIPVDDAPPTLDFSSAGIGVNFESLAPDLGQIFFIGDGMTALGAFQKFIAPVGATRLFLGIPDGFGFNGAPGAYDDNDGSYRIRLAINENPVPMPEPSMVFLFLAGLVGIALFAAPRYFARRRH